MSVLHSGRIVTIFAWRCPQNLYCSIRVVEDKKLL